MLYQLVKKALDADEGDGEVTALQQSDGPNAPAEQAQAKSRPASKVKLPPGKKYAFFGRSTPAHL